MPIGLLKDIVSDRPLDANLLGLDVGKKTIGLAMVSAGMTIATPLHTIKRIKFTKDILEIQKSIKEYDIGGFVIGLPVNMDGSEGPRAQSVRDFAAEMANNPDIFGEDPWIAFWDERLSTVSVEASVDNLVEKRKIKSESKSSGLIDKLAAQMILQGAIEYMLN